MTLFITIVWCGGMAAMPDTKVGFWRRVLWPAEFGETLAEWIFTQGGGEE